MEVELDASEDALFNYDYRFCVFMHNIPGSKSEVSDGMLNPSTLTADFFASPRGTPVTSVAAPSLDPVTVSREDHSESSPIAAITGQLFRLIPRLSRTRSQNRALYFSAFVPNIFLFIVFPHLCLMLFLSTVNVCTKFC